MKKVEFHQKKSDLPSLAKLLLDRQINESETLTCLRDRTIDHGYVQGILGELFEKSTIMGVGAYRDELMVGYIFGIVKIDAERGRHIWMPYEGVAIMDIGGYLPFNSGSVVDVREGRVSDREAVANMSDIIFSYQNQSPVYAAALPETVVSIRDGFAGIVDDEAFLLVAEKDDVAVGYQVYYPLEASLMAPEFGIELGVQKVVEAMKARMTSLTSLFAERKIVTECWGHYYRKL